MYPLPRIEELFAAIYGGKVFSKLDLYSSWIVPLHLPSVWCYVNTSHISTYHEDGGDLPMVVVSLDDILFAGETEKEHLLNLSQVLECLDSAGMKL